MVTKKHKPGHEAAQELVKADRDLRILELRRSGLSYAKIAAETGVAQQTAYKIVKGYLEKVAAECTEEAKELIALECERLDSLYKALEPKIEVGETKAITAATKIMERRARLLGLDQPDKLEQVVRFENLPSSELVSRAKARGIPIPEEILRAAKEEEHEYQRQPRTDSA